MMTRNACWLIHAAATLATASGQIASIAGYTPVSDVVEHSELDLDVLSMEVGADLLTEAGFAAAFTHYSVGGNSNKTDSLRTVQGFSTGALEKLTGEKYFDIYNAYWGTPDYADVFTSGACEGTGDFATASFATRSEACLKGAQYQNVWMYVIHELEDAVGDCNNGDLSANDGGPHAWDEGWAFYAGSLEGVASGGSGDGQMVYALAEKRCENFGTCTGDDDGDDFTGISQVNTEILALYKTGSANLLDGDCDAASLVKDEIVTLMAIPLMQGLLRYTYLADPAAGAGGDKEAAELWAFSASILPWISSCDAEVASAVLSNTNIASSNAPMSTGYVALKAQIETVYECMGITCAQVGGLYDTANAAFFTGFEACEDSTAAAGDIDAIAGYTPVSDVVAHSQLDLDVADMEAGADLLTEAGFTAAFTAYSVGGNSNKTDSIRTVQGFSTDAEEKLTGEKYFDIYNAYWGTPDYADVFTTAACEGTGDFAGASVDTRSEGCLKGAQYQNVWMYVIHELEDAIGDCNDGNLSANDGGPHAWDEGWAFYAGSLEGVVAGGSGDGQMVYALAEKRCENFGTCTGDDDGDDFTGISQVNTEILALYDTGSANLLDGDCDAASLVKDEIVTLMAIPLMQGLLRYTYLADPAAGAGGDKEASELWAFSASILPWIDSCDADVATAVRSNTDITSATAPMSDGYVALKAQIETVYECMGITCAQIGGLYDTANAAFFTGFEACEDSTAAAGDIDAIAGYTPVSDVVEHSQLDLDVADMEAGADLLTEAGFTAAFTAYSVGGNSAKTDSIRTVQGFSTDAEEKLTGEKYFDIYNAYWGTPDYADVFTTAACEGTGDFAGASVDTRSEGCLKGAQYQNVWMYVIHELEDAIGDCNDGNLSANDGGPHAWDEGWAFYAGSLEGVAAGGSGDGQMVYALAEKRCENFGTCTGDDDGDDFTGISQVNTEILALYDTGSANLLDGDCDAASLVKDEIVTLMAIPLMQGLLRYTYLADPAAGAGGDKEASELWAFSASILPWIDSCDADVATAVRSNTDITSATAPMSDGYVALKAQIETVYECMGITCAQIGGLYDTANAAFFTGFEACEDSSDRGVTTTDSTTGDIEAIAGYTPVSDVVEHSQIDLDVLEMEVGADLLTEAGFSAAFTAYSVGGNSAKSDSTRTVQGFSTDAQEKLTGEKYFDIYSAYWGTPDYADVFTTAACEGTGDFATASFDTRSEGCLKGAQYQNVWMYVIHELEDAVGDCNNGDLSANDGGPHAWDEGWAFYAGSLEGTPVGGSGDGQLLYALAEKRCENFGTCTGDNDGDAFSGVSEINDEILDLYNTGSAHLISGDCDAAELVKDDIAKLMVVPLVQGLLRYTYLADPNVGDAADKEASELWAFSASVLPLIDACDSEVADVVRSNTDITSAAAPMSDGYVALKAQIETVYGCMGISCAQVGGLYDSANSEYFTGFEECAGSSISTAGTDGDDDGLSGGGIAGVTIAVGAIAVLGVVAFAMWKKKKTKSAATVDENLGNF